MSLLPQAGDGTLMVSALTSCISEPLWYTTAPPFFPWQMLASAASWWVWRARQTRARHDKHLTSVSAWEQLGLRASEPSDCLVISSHTLLCLLGFHVQTQDGNTEDNYWTTTTLFIGAQVNRLCFDLLYFCWCWYVRTPPPQKKAQFFCLYSIITYSVYGYVYT